MNNNKKAFTPLEKDIKRHNSLTGFTFVEVVIAMLIVTIVVAGMFSALTATHIIYKRAWHRIQAINFAREAVDRLKSNHSYTDTAMVAPASHTENEIISLPNRIIQGDMADVFNATLSYDVANVTEPAYPANIICKQVSVTVTWQETGYRELYD